LKKSYQKGDKVLVESWGLPIVKVTLTKRYLKTGSGLGVDVLSLGVDGWEAQITIKKEVEKLRANGVPYNKGEKPTVFVADWQIIKKCR
jgi:hypothetical protein